MRLSFLKLLRQQLSTALLTGVSIGLIATVLLLVTGGLQGSINLDLEVGAYDGGWLIAAAPLVLALLTLVAFPLSYLLHWLINRNR